MGKIFCIMGKSSTGKDTIFKRLVNDPDLGFKAVNLYTTRPIREGEKDGDEYFFIDEQTLLKLEYEGKIIEKRSYNTIQGIWHYCLVDDGRVDLEKYNYLLITTLEGYGSMRSHFGPEKVEAYYVYLDDVTRMVRALEREGRLPNPDCNELCRRFLADNEDFSEDKLKKLGVVNRYMNIDLEKCTRQIKTDMMKNKV